ncbi:MAG: LytTR family DNA-binding domain-containing protein, partial [Bacteroidota bacterium]
PDQDDLPSIFKGAVIGGGVVFFMLYAFRPFGIGYTSSPATICAIFGIISTVVAIVYELVMKYVLRIRKEDPSWTFWKWAVSVVGLIVCIAIANYAVSAYLGYMGEDVVRIWAFGNVLFGTFLIAIFPVALFGAVNLIRKLQANQAIAKDIQPQAFREAASQIVPLPIHQSEKTLEVDLDQLLLIEAQQNYVRLFLLTDEGLKKEMLRNTLSRVEAALTNSPIKRSHRSYLVHTQKIASVSGNAQGLKLKLTGLADLEVPVSRKYIPDFRPN